MSDLSKDLVDAAAEAAHAESVTAEARRVVRHFQRYSSELRADLAASHRVGYRQRQAVGEYFYTHPDVPGRAFSTRFAAARAAVGAIGTAVDLDALAEIAEASNG